MSTIDRYTIFDKPNTLTLSNQERKYLCLDEINPTWKKRIFYSKTNLWYTRTTVFIDGNTIVKTITEQKKVLNDNEITYQDYQESDTRLETINGDTLLPLTSRGKPKPLTASNINAVTPFGCSLFISFEKDKDTLIRLDHRRACKRFPLGERAQIASIRNEDDFHSFMQYYIATCPNNYFDKLNAFKNSKKQTIKYKVGDIFRMEYDRTRYCYGIISGDIKKIKTMPELPKRHSLRNLMTVPIMVRMYRLITDDPNMTADKLQAYQLGRVQICSDNDIIWGTHTIVDHKRIQASDLEFNFVCTKIVSFDHRKTLFTDDMILSHKRTPPMEYTLFIEWGFAQTLIEYDGISDKLKELFNDYSSPHGGVSLCIDPYDAIPDEKNRTHYTYRNNLLNPENRDFLNEIFTCLGLEPDISFDQFAAHFGAMSLQEIADRIGV